MTVDSWVVVGGGGFVGSAVTRRLAARGAHVTVVDRVPPPARTGFVDWRQADLLEDDVELPGGVVVLVAGVSDPRPRRPWLLGVGNALSTARLAPALADRDVVHVSSAEVYGWAGAPLREDTRPELPVAERRLAAWCRDALALASRPCPPWQAYALGAELAALDPSGRWVYALSKACQELIVRSVVPDDRLVVLRPANLFGPGQDRIVTTLIRRLLTGRELIVTSGTTRTFAPVDELVDAVTAKLDPGTYNVGSTVLRLDELAERVMRHVGRSAPIVWSRPQRPDSCGVVDASKIARVLPPRPFDPALAALVRHVRSDDPPLFALPLQVVVPPRPERPDVVAARQHAALWSGEVKNGNRWTGELTERLTETVRLRPDQRLLVTSSGTAALRLALWATVGRAVPGDVVVVPSFTFAATAEVVAQLGYRPEYVDIDESTWTMDPSTLDRLLASTPRVRAVIPVDALGNPAPYADIADVCRRRGVPMVADSAPSLGALAGGVPVGSQADAHAFSMSFAKVISAGGAGGAVVLPRDAEVDRGANWGRSSLMSEMNAIVALDQLVVLDDLVERRSAVAATYDAALAAWGVTRQGVRPGDRHSWVHYVVRVPDRLSRDAVARSLARLGVETKPYYAPLAHRLLPTGSGEPSALAVTERVGATALALPMSSEMTASDATRVVLAMDRAVIEARGAADAGMLRPAVR